MCTRAQCERAVGQWVRFQTPWGTHRGVIEQVTGNGVLVRVPRSYAPVGLASGSDEDRLDVTLAQWGYGYPYARPYGRWGYPGYGYWYGGWWWWWLAFAWIFWLAFLW